MKIRYLLLIILTAFCILLLSCEEGGIPQTETESTHIHIYSNTVVNPTCTDKGYTVKTCECGDTLNVSYVDAIGHDATAWTTVKAPSCTEEGKSELRCNVCAELIEQRLTSKLNHSTVESVTEPTCVEQGYTTHVCENCGYTYKNSYLPKLKHEEGEAITVKNPTCKTTGEREYRCTGCDTLIRKQTLGIISCNYVSYPTEASGSTEAHTLYVCSSCGDSYKGPYISKDALAQATAKEIYNNSKNALVEIVSFDKAGKSMMVGSGFFISEDGYIITNYHVIRAAYSLSIFKYSGGNAIRNVKVVACNAQYDIALLKIETTGETYLEFSTVTPETGDTVYALGSSYGLADTFSMGIVSNTDRYANGINCIQFTAPISSGNSGGPLIDRYGKVIGVVSMTVPDAQNINFAIKSTIAELIITHQKLDTPLDISALYEETLSQNALYILKFYIMNNHTGHGDGYYYIFEYEPSTATSLAREYYYIYDTEKDKIYLQIDLVASKTGMNRLTITVELDDNNDGYFWVSMYDYDFSQTTLSGLLDHTAELKIMGTTFNEDYFDSVFSNVEIKYLDTDTENSPQKMKTLFYQSYSSLIAKFSYMLGASHTGVTAETLDISLPQ